MRWAPALLLIAQSLHAAAPWGKQAYGVLLIGDVPGSAFEKTAAQVKKDLGPGVPLETAVGTFSTRMLQSALDKLQSQRVGKIVVVSLSLYSQSPEVEQLKYLLGINEYPSKEYLTLWRLKEQTIKRAKAKVPLVWAGGLDSDGAVSSILLEQAKSISRRPKREAVVLVGRGAIDDELNAAKEKILTRLARRVRRQGSFREARALLLRPASKDKPKLAAESEKALHDAVAGLSRQGKVLVVPHLLVADGTERQIEKKLEHLFYRYKASGLLPDARVAQWVLATVNFAAKGPDMVAHKDDGKRSPSPKPGKDRKLQLNR